MTHSRSSSMETAVFLGLLGIGYVASKTIGNKEGFQNLEGTPDLRLGPNTTYSPGKNDGGRSPSTYAATRAEVYTPANARTVAGKPRQPNTLGAGKYDEQFMLPSGGSLPGEPNPSQLQAIPNGYFPVPALSLPTQDDPTVADGLQMRPDGWEDATARKGFVSALSGVEFAPGEFKHQNMVPFFRGQIKQSVVDNANNQILDNYSGSGKTLFAKR